MNRSTFVDDYVSKGSANLSTIIFNLFIKELELEFAVYIQLPPNSVEVVGFVKEDVNRASARIQKVFDSLDVFLSHFIEKYQVIINETKLRHLLFDIFSFFRSFSFMRVNLMIYSGLWIC